jgi:hypothetical protein
VGPPDRLSTLESADTGEPVNGIALIAVIGRKELRDIRRSGAEEIDARRQDRSHDGGLVVDEETLGQDIAVSREMALPEFIADGSRGLTLFCQCLFPGEIAKHGAGAKHGKKPRSQVLKTDPFRCAEAAQRVGLVY